MHRYIARVEIVLLEDGVETLIDRTSLMAEYLADVERAYLRAKDALPRNVGARVAP